MTSMAQTTYNSLPSSVNSKKSINIDYKPITEDFLNEVVGLHNEWFPFSYDRNYFRKYVFRHNNVAIGAFLKLGLKEYLVGCVR